ncbi:antibiotic synthetase, putative [Ricinus communis]|uniref:Antibiotic synthetase, putative n=1 Tax=Ricinus communis TaxID=3988 RepID=B9TMJ6_RICCO|nr:antibiotic synthetase, putative [Ricinus communis]
MLPQHIVILDALPMTPNLKIDRKALPEPALEESAESRAPVTPSEQLLATIWREVLKIDTVALDENFFDCGGHSLTAVDAIRRVYQQTGHRFEVREFIMETLEQLAAKLDQPANTKSSNPAVDNEQAASSSERGLGKFMRRFTGKRS